MIWSAPTRTIVLGLNAAQTTLGTVAELAGLRLREWPGRVRVRAGRDTLLRLTMSRPAGLGSRAQNGEFNSGERNVFEPTRGTP